MSAVTDAASLCYSLYAYDGAPKVAWDYFDDGTNSDGIYWAVVRLNGILWVVNRGSVLLYPDWVRDFYDWVDPFLHDNLGQIHPGFYKGVPTVCKKVLELAKPDEKIGITGHSLGAGRGRLETGELCLSGRVPDEMVLFGEPHSGGDVLATVTAQVKSGVTFRNVGEDGADWNDYDLVTGVPPWFLKPGSRQDKIVYPATDDKWGPLRFHHFQLYAGAVGFSQS